MQDDVRCGGIGSGSDEFPDVSAGDNTIDGIDSRTISWTVFIFLTLVHVWENYVAVAGLRLRTLNRERTNAALHGVWKDRAVRLFAAETTVVDSNDCSDDTNLDNANVDDIPLHH